MNKRHNVHVSRQDQRRAGNTLVVALGVLTVVIAAISLSSVGATTTLRDIKDGGARVQVLAAVEAVLARHERILLDRADSGTLADFGTTAAPLAVDNNYGLDMVGNCSVRWKIEPCRTQDYDNTLDFVINPPPTGITETPLALVEGNPLAADIPAVRRKENSINFMFRISAEAALRASPNTPAIAVAQGARYAVAVNAPLFRNIIFYAQIGPNGDLEISHDPQVDIKGNIHSNGAIYVGSGTWVNHWGAAAGGSGNTLLGPNADGSPITVTGVDGIFCLSKPLMFGALNKYPIGGNPPGWYSVWNWSSIYDPQGAPNPAAGSTYLINPKGVLDAAAFNTNSVSSAVKRRINGQDLYSGQTIGTDSRDSERGDPNKWALQSTVYFERKARSSETGGSKIPLTLAEKGREVNASSRPFDPIQLTRFASAANPNVDAPELSTPAVSATGVETPGYYLSRVNGGTITRFVDGTGWAVAPLAPASNTFGLAIRERPIPDTTIWPGAGVFMAPMSPLDPNYMPYAYGKHWYPTNMPFYPVWVTAGMSGSTNTAWSAGINTSPEMNTLKYLGNGSLLMSSACSAGSPSITNGDAQIYYNNNWQFTHLRKPEQFTSGINASLFIENTAFAGSNNPGVSGHRMQGVPILSTPANMNWANLAAINATFTPTPLAMSNFTIRCEGFVVPGSSDDYTFNASFPANTPASINGARIWVDGRRVYENWGADPITTTIPLIENVPYPLVVEMFNDAGPASLVVNWDRTGSSAGPVPIPAASLFQRNNQAYTRAGWTSLTTRLDPDVISGPATMKAGLMVRPGDGGLSPLLSGRDAYLMIGYSPGRGIFTERRMAPSMMTKRQTASWYTGPGATVTEIPAVSGFAVTADGVMNVPSPHSGSYTVDGNTSTATVTRAAKLTPSYLPLPAPPNPPTVERGYSPGTTNSEQANRGVISIDGRPVKITYGFTDDGIWSQTGRYYVRTITNVAQSVVWTNLDGTGVFSGLQGKTVNIYANNSTSTANTLYTTAVTANSFTTSQTYWKVTPYLYSLPLTSSQSYNAKWVYWTDDARGLDFIVQRLRDLGWNGGGWIAAPTGLGLPTTDTITLSGSRPADPGLIAPDSPGYETATHQFAINNNYTFAINMGGVTPPVDISVNSYITSSGLWFDPPVPKNIPWALPWTAALPHPLTSSHAPDMWVNAGPGLATPPGVAVGNPSPNANGSLPRFTDDVAVPAGTSEIWLRLTSPLGGAAPDLVSFSYYIGAVPPTSTTVYTPVLDYGGLPLTADIAGWGADLLMGPCLQSGITSNAATALFSELKVGSTDLGANSSNEFDASIWDVIPGTGGRNPMSAYLASQYQVFWGDKDITEDFFSYNQAVFNGRTATEEGYVNPREFWSQSRWWEDGTEKDALPAGNAAVPNTENRQLWARSTFLTLNLNQIQSYLANTDVTQAQNLPITTPTARPAFTGPALSGQFNGILYAARTNRYQWNPTPGLTPAVNPFSYNTTNANCALPNAAANTGAATMLNGTNMSDPSMFEAGIHKLQPYTVGTDISEAPPFKPQHFHHGVRLINGASITWGVSAGNTFGSGGTNIITPNQLFVQGDLNTTKTSVVVPGVVGQQMKNTPLAIVGDQITFLSNSFGPTTTTTRTSTPASLTIARYSTNSMNVHTPTTTTITTPNPNSTSVTTVTRSIEAQPDTSRLQGFVRYSPALVASNYLPPILLNPTTLGQASSTTYVAAIVTNNQPTTSERVKEGQGAPFIDTMQFLERWGNGVRMDYTGSLVVIDSRRYTDAFLLDAPRTAGRNPFGTMGWNALVTWGGNGTASGPLGGVVPIVYTSPDRTMTFNLDLLTAEGTPPGTPNGVASKGLGGWVRVVK